METKQKVTKNVVTFPKLPEGYKVLYLRTRNKVPVGCLVYHEKMLDNKKCLITLGYSSLARTDEKGVPRIVRNDSHKAHSVLEVKVTGVVSPSCKVGRTRALEVLQTAPVELKLDLPSDAKIGKDGKPFVMKEHILNAVLESKLGTETFRSKVKNHMKWAAKRANNKKSSKGDVSYLLWKGLPKDLVGEIFKKFSSISALEEALRTKLLA